MDNNLPQGFIGSWYANPPRVNIVDYSQLGPGEQFNASLGNDIPINHSTIKLLTHLKVTFSTPFISPP